MSNRVLVYRMGSQPNLRAVVFWTSPKVTAAEISDSVRDFSEIEGPVGEVCLLTWHHCAPLFDELVKAPLDLRVESTDIYGARLNADVTWHLHRLKQSEVSNILSAGYESLFVRHGGILEAPDGYHYEKLSHDHSKKFLRAANVFVNSNESALFAFGVLTKLRLKKSPEIVYTDTSAINVVGHVVSDFFAGPGTLSPIPVVSFGSYEGLTRGFEFDFSDSGIVIMSATTSGNLQAKLVKNHEIPEDRICTLFAANKLEGLTVLFNVSEVQGGPFGEIVNYPPGDCPLCKRDEPVITISGDQFLPEPARCRPFELLSKDLSKGAKRFVNDLSNGKVTCHFRLSDGSRRLFNLELFGEPECVAEREIRRQFGLLFARRGLSVLVPRGTSNLEWTREGHFDAPCTELISEIEGQSTIGVFCPVNYGSGNSASLALDLRRLPGDPPRSFLLGVSIYTGTDEKSETEKTLRYRKEGWSYLVESVYDIFLPPSRSGKTPWELELDWWKDQPVVSEWSCVAARKQLLLEASELQGDNLFLPTFDGKPLDATEGFAFFDAGKPPGDQPLIYLTICLVLHDRRMKRKGSSTPHNREVVEPRMFNRFTDPAIQGALLRGALVEELNYAGDRELSDRFSQIVSTLISSGGIGPGSALGEFCFAILSNRVHLDGDVRNRVLSEIAKLDGLESEWARCFAKIADHQLASR